MIKHISFDLWMTLIKSNPEYKIKRAKLLIDSFGIEALSPSDVDSQIRSFDKIFDRYNELSRKKISANEMYRRVLNRILGKEISEQEAIGFRNEADRLFLEYTPCLLNENIANMLENLKSEGYTLNLSSNTGFIEGEILRQSLTDLGIFNFFSFSIFSDEVNTSKPSSYFFQKAYDQITVSKSEVLHIGDNVKTDYQGAKSFGFEAMLITDPDYTVNDVMDQIGLLDS